MAGTLIHLMNLIATPRLAEACSQGKIETAKVLKETGADIDYGIGTMATPLGMATGRGHLDMVKWLVDKGASLECEYDLHGCKMNPQILAGNEGHSEIVKFLNDLSGVTFQREVDFKQLNAQQILEAKYGFPEMVCDDDQSASSLIFFNQNNERGVYSLGLSRVVFGNQHTKCCYELICFFSDQVDSSYQTESDEAVTWLIDWLTQIKYWATTQDTPLENLGLFRCDDKLISSPPDITFTGLLMMEGEVLAEPDGSAVFKALHIVPIYQSEVEFAEQRSREELAEKLQDHNFVGVFDPSRDALNL